MTNSRRSILLIVLLALAFVLAACAPIEEYDDFPEPPPGFELTTQALQQEQPAEPAGPSATLEVLSGEATVQRAGDSQAQAAANGDQLGVGDSVDTGTSGLVLLTFAEGTQTYAYPGTVLTITTMDTAPNGRLILVLEMAQGLTFNRTNGRSTESSDLVTPYATVSTEQAAGSSGHSFNRFSRASRPALSTVFLTTQHWTDLQFAPVPGTHVVLVNVTQGSVRFTTGDPGAETQFSVPAGQSVEQDEDGQIQVNNDLTLTCNNGYCYPEEIDAWVADGTLGDDEGETAIILPPDDEICDPDFDGCESELFEDAECDPAAEDCGDEFLDDECDPNAEDCGDNISGEDCDPDAEDCGDEFLDEDCDPDAEDCGDDSFDEESDDASDDGAYDESDESDESDDY